MPFWHWGVNFNGHEHPHYIFMLNHRIIIGSEAVTYEVGDLVAVHKGHGLLAIARVDGPPQPLGLIFDGVNLFAAYGIDQNLHPIYAPATFKRVFPVYNGAGAIVNPIRQQMIQSIWDILPEPNG